MYSMYPSGPTESEVDPNSASFMASAVSSTMNAQPWECPALGARVAWSRARSITAGSTGSGV